MKDNLLFSEVKLSLDRFEIVRLTFITESALPKGNGPDR